MVDKPPIDPRIEHNLPAAGIENLYAGPLGATQGYLNRTATGSAFLILRQVLVQFINLAGGIALARYLSVGEFGFLGVITYIMGVLASLSDVGLTLSLLQQKNSPSNREYSVAFTAQGFLACIAAAGFVCLIPWIQKHYGLTDSSKVYLFIAAGSFLIYIFRSIPQTRLERDLRFTKLAILEVVLSVAYNGCAIILAVMGAKVWSFMIAIVFRTVLSVVILNILCWTRLRFAWDWRLLRRQLSSGFSMQLSTYISMIKDSMSPVIIGISLGLTATGIANMAGLIANSPTYFCSILGRMYLPAFSRVKDMQAELDKLFSTSVFVVNSVVAPLSFFVLLFRESFTCVLFGPKWLQTEILYPFLWTANLVVPTTQICMGLLNAIGEPRKNVFFSTLWAVIVIGLGTPLIALCGLVGLGYAVFMVNLSMVGYFIYIHVKYGHNVFPGIVKAWLPAALSAVLFLAVRTSMPAKFSGAMNSIYSGGVAYLLIAVFLWLGIYRNKARMLLQFFLAGQGR